MSTILEEALENLKVLDEAFSDSMPDWLVARLQRFAPTYGAASSKIRNGRKLPFRNSLIDQQKSPSHGRQWFGDDNFFNLFLRAGYNLSKLPIIPKEIPNKLDDPIFDDPDLLPILHLVSNKDDKIWVPGLNDDEQFQDNDGKWFKFKYMNNKRLKEYVKDLVCADLSKEEAHIPQEIYQRDSINRALYSGQPLHYGDLDRVYEKPYEKNRRYNFNRDSRYYSGDDPKRYFDKSGYYTGKGIINYDLQNRLEKYKAKFGFQKFIDIQNKMQQLQDAVVQYVNQQDVLAQDLRTSNYLSQSQDIRLILEEYQNVVRKFLRAQEVIDNATNRNQELEPYFVSTELKNLNLNIDHCLGIVPTGFNAATFVW